MVRRIGFLILLSLLFSFTIEAQSRKAFELLKLFSIYYSKGDILNAEKCLLNVVSLKDSLSIEQSIAVNNNLGVIFIRLGRYDDAINYLNLAEDEVNNKKTFLQELADIYINKARVFGIIKEYDKAIEYLEQGVKIYLSNKEVSKSLLFRTSSAFLNLGLIYYEKKEYNTAIEYLNRSLELKLKNNLSEIAFVYLNLAKTYSKLNQEKKAQQYYLKSIEAFDIEFGPNYYRLTSVLFDYGLFLQSIGRVQESFNVHKRALDICLKNYGEKHTYVSLAYKLLGDHFLNKKEFNTALKYYQKSVVAVVSNFNDTCIYSNPPLDSVIFDIRLLDNLKKKSFALEQYALQFSGNEDKTQVLKKGLETIELALELIGRIRNGYVSIESKMYLAENEKETYFLAEDIAYKLYVQTKDQDYIKRMYRIATFCKSAILRNEIAENDFLNRSVTDSLYFLRNELLVNIASYKKLVQDELQKTKPDIQKIELWKSTLFEMNKDEERVSKRVKTLYPEYEQLIQVSKPTDIKTLQSNLSNDETIVEYFLSNRYTQDDRLLYIFTITKDRLNFTISYIDSSFNTQVESIKKGLTTIDYSNYSHITFKNYTHALFYLYEKLIKPIKENLSTKLIIIPDEEISYLPFDALISSPAKTDEISYDELHYLLYDYSITYGYTSSLLYRNEKRLATKCVYAFSPSYTESPEKLSNLKGTNKEIQAILNWFNGSAFFGKDASEHNFKELINQHAIFHLAMHTQTDPNNSKYSSLVFNNQIDTIEDGKLFNYEVSLCRINSPMVVLSGCSTASGDLYHGEGIMSLGRGFLLAGASSVVNTLWDVNDESSAKIMSDFYYNLSRGYEKGASLRMAKINYLKNSLPTYTNPYYWAAYEVMGDNTPIKLNNRVYYLLGLISGISICLFYIFLRWARRY